MLLWQFYNYNQALNQEAAAHPQQERFYFYNTNTGPTTPAVTRPAIDGADVHQLAYSVEPNKPGPGNFTSTVILKNVGNAKATGIQVMVRPYRGIKIGDEDNGPATAHMLDENDPTSLYGQWLTFPDLAPGESATQTIVFASQPNITPGTNPNPQILFQSEKAKP